MPSSQWPIYLGTTAGTPMAKLITQAGKQSIFDVANTTERTSVITQLAAAGVDVTIVYVHRRDAAAGAQLEVTTDSGATWRAVPSASSAVAVTLASGWSTEGGFNTLAVRALGNGQAVLRGSRIARAATTFEVDPGVAFTIGTLPSTHLPTNTHVGMCSYGVAGNLGNGPLQITTAGDIQVVYWEVPGTMAVGGGISNSIWIPTQTINL